LFSSTTARWLRWVNTRNQSAAGLINDQGDRSGPRSGLHCYPFDCETAPYAQSRHGNSDERLPCPAHPPARPRVHAPSIASRHCPRHGTAPERRGGARRSGASHTTTAHQPMPPTPAHSCSPIACAALEAVWQPNSGDRK
jgi:hypothetical protein